MNGQCISIRRIQRTAYLLVCLLAVTNHSNAIAGDVAIVQPFLGETAVLVLKVDPTRLALPDVSDSVKATFPKGQVAYDRWAEDVARGIERLRVATGGHAAYATIGIPLSENEWPVFLFVKDTSEPTRKQFTDLWESLHEVQSCTREGCTVVAPGGHIDLESRLDAIVPSPRPELTAAFEAVKDYPMQALLLPPDYVRRTVTELMPQLPRHLGGGPSSVLTDGLMWAALGIDPAAPRAELVIQSASERAARDLAKHFPKMLLSAYDELPEAKRPIPVDSFQTLLPLFQPRVAGARITIRLDELQAISEGLRLMSSAPAAVAEQIRRRTNSDKFKQIMLGLHNFHDTYRQFPPHEASGHSDLSWRVHILPFIEQQKLYEEFALDQPWDSPHNKRLIEKVPKIYASQWLGIKPGHTTFLAPVGKDTIFGGDKPVRFHNIIDGTSNTVAVVEVKPSLSVPWTAPKDYAFDPESPEKGLRVGDDERFFAGLADGSVQMLRGDMGREFMLRLFRKSDVQPLNWDRIR